MLLDLVRLFRKHSEIEFLVGILYKKVEKLEPLTFCLKDKLNFKI